MKPIPGSDFGGWPRWVAIYSEPRSEVLAGWGLDAAGVEKFLPMCRVRSHKRSEGDVYRPLFSRYLFAHILPEQHHTVVSRRGVASILCHEGTPVGVPDAVISDLRSACQMGLFDERRAKQFTAGDVVRLIKGPFAQFVGKIQRFRSRERVEIMLQMFGSARPIEMMLDGIEQIRA